MSFGAPAAGSRIKVASTDTIALRSTGQLGWLGVHPDTLHPTNSDPWSGFGVSMTLKTEKLAVQVVPQSIPFGRLSTVPVPFPLLLIVNRNVDCAPAPSATLKSIFPGV